MKNKIELPTKAEVESVCRGHDLKLTSVQDTEFSLIFELAIGPDFKRAAFESRLEDYSLILGMPMRLLLPYKKGVIGLELAKLDASLSFSKAMELMKEDSSPLAIPVGICGTEFKSLRLDEALHLLVAGSTGSGKSCFLRCAVESLRSRNTPKTLRLAIVDVKGVDFASYSGDSFLYNPADPYQIINTADKTLAFLDTLHREMKIRFDKIKAAGGRDFSAISDKTPYIVTVIDEFSQLCGENDKQEAINASVSKIAELGRSAGIYLILATQKPLSSVVSGTIKSNFPSRISFRLPARRDYMTILDEVPNSVSNEPRGSAWIKSPSFSSLTHFKAPLPIADSDIKILKISAPQLPVNSCRWDFPMDRIWAHFVSYPIEAVSCLKVIYSLPLEHRKPTTNDFLVNINDVAQVREGEVVLQYADRHRFGLTLPQWERCMRAGTGIGFLKPVKDSPVPAFCMDIGLFLQYYIQDVDRIRKIYQDKPNNEFMVDTWGTPESLALNCYKLEKGNNS